MKAYDLLLDQSIKSAVKMGLHILRDFPESRAALMRLLVHLPKAAKRRDSFKKQGVIVPPLLIVSTTERCNLHCAGCYAQAQIRDAKTEMSGAQIDSLLSQAVHAGCAIILMAGGEPLLCDDWLEAVAARPELLGLVFTNGTLLDDERCDWFAANRNMIPLFSVEGDFRVTNQRRGDGVAESVDRAMQLLLKQAIPFGLSVTTGEHNIKHVAQQDFLETFFTLGCRLSIFTEYVPVADTDQLLALTEESKLALQKFCRETSKDMICIAFPGDETVFDGCLAAGRGFAHISTTGELEPCPFAAYSDRNVLDSSFLDALSSPLFQKIRSESHLLHEGGGGCALRNMGFMK